MSAADELMRDIRESERITLRREFARAALTGILAAEGPADGELYAGYHDDRRKSAAKDAWAIADAMLATEPKDALDQWAREHLLALVRLGRQHFRYATATEAYDGECAVKAFERGAR